MPALSAILPLLRNPWILLVIACVVGIGGTGWYRLQWLEEKAARAADLNEADQAALHQIERDKEKRAEVDAQYQAEIARLKASNREETIRKAPGGGPVPEPYRALFDSVQRGQGTPGDREAGRGPTGRPQPVP